MDQIVIDGLLMSRPQNGHVALLTPCWRERERESIIRHLTKQSTLPCCCILTLSDFELCSWHLRAPAETDAHEVSEEKHYKKCTFLQSQWGRGEGSLVLLMHWLPLVCTYNPNLWPAPYSHALSIQQNSYHKPNFRNSFRVSRRSPTAKGTNMHQAWPAMGRGHSW